MLRNRTASFDYKGLDGSAREVLQSHARTLSELSRRTAKNLWKMGKILADVRERLASHNGGSFKHWVENEAGLSRSTAYRLINVYRTFSCPTVGQLGISPKVLYLLSEPSTPAAAREEALRYARDGERITHARAQEIVQQHRPSRPPLPPLPP
ncbi:MAG: hypothetical protein GTO63_21255, partial [Anaerolineae bacterium]|nr:hypothetical protein [Anaerolineae bacterium]NIN97323.1 hypothetical protein [Anaerolineae bacterium]NIQ80243.1 hypothetical protein [Anaerolineae bacterium]